MFSYENDEMVVDDISSSVLKNTFAGHRAVTVYIPKIEPKLCHPDLLDARFSHAFFFPFSLTLWLTLRAICLSRLPSVSCFRFRCCSLFSAVVYFHSPKCWAKWWQLDD